jgi:hypothetical protein
MAMPDRTATMRLRLAILSGVVSPGGKADVTAAHYRSVSAHPPTAFGLFPGWSMTGLEVTPAAVVWWKTSLALVEVPRRHTIGWSDATGAPFGTITIVSPHPRLDRRTIETALAAELVSSYPISPRLGTAAELRDLLSAEAGLRAAGHQVLTRDLTTVYGHRALGGVVATLLGKGIDAYILIDKHASAAARTAICQTAEQALTHFRTASPEELYDSGWERDRQGRWQLLLQQR